MGCMGSSIRKLTAPQNLTALAYDSIKRHILEGKLDEDTRLTEEFLSNRLGISKSPVREALNSSADRRLDPYRTAERGPPAAILRQRSEKPL